MRMPRSHADAARVRDQATTLLTELVTQRERLEATMHENGRRDQLKSITGHSALDNSIQATRRIIASIDRLLEASEHARVGASFTGRSDYTRSVGA